MDVVKLSAKRQYDEAISLTNEYIEIVESEIINAKEAVEITYKLLKSQPQSNNTPLRRREVADELGITIDTLRNWEMNELINVKRKENGYRIYHDKDIQKLKIIRSLRCANYSLSAILRMMNALSENENIDVEHVLNTPGENEDIISACDKLILSLNDAKKNARKILFMLSKMKNKY